MQINAKQIAHNLYDRTFTADQALLHLGSVRSGDKHQMIDEILFVSGVLNRPNSSQEAGCDRYVWGLEVITELLNKADSPVRTKLVNHLHAGIFNDVRSGALENDKLPERYRTGLIQIYRGIQERSAVAAMYFLSRGMNLGRNSRIFEYLDSHIDRSLIIDAAVQVKRVDILYQRSKWSECLPHLNDKSRDAHFGGDLGL